MDELFHGEPRPEILKERERSKDKNQKIGIVTNRYDEALLLMSAWFVHRMMSNNWTFG